jgi:hypothetical protein
LISTHQPWILWYAIAMHLCWGTSMLMLEPHPLYFGTRWFLLNGGYQIWGIILLVGAFLALIGMFVPSPIHKLYFLIPQQGVLIIGMIGAIVMWYQDLAPQTIVVLGLGYLIPIALCHTLAILDHCGIIHSLKISFIAHKLHSAK